MDDLKTLVDRARDEFAQCADPAALENAKAKYLGKSGAITEHMKALAKLGASERPAAGARINYVKAVIEDELAKRRAALADEKLAAQLASEALDVSLPGRGASVGGLHPLTRTLDR
ncbi:MAG TPA: phenylalanine--tRNA ligase subunit alpha, partial [Casimicrobiaceae bacterium]|nr:phenylalanine--tRNA ligase subunit alpha [Casimicrobiaceae bacterium]